MFTLTLTVNRRIAAVAAMRRSGMPASAVWVDGRVLAVSGEAALREFLPHIDGVPGEAAANLAHTLRGYLPEKSPPRADPRLHRKRL